LQAVPGFTGRPACGARAGTRVQQGSGLEVDQKLVSLLEGPGDRSIGGRQARSCIGRRVLDRADDDPRALTGAIALRQGAGAGGEAGPSNPVQQGFNTLTQGRRQVRAQGNLT